MYLLTCFESELKSEKFLVSYWKVIGAEANLQTCSHLFWKFWTRATGSTGQ